MQEFRSVLKRAFLYVAVYAVVAVLIMTQLITGDVTVSYSASLTQMGVFVPCLPGIRGIVALTARTTINNAIRSKAFFIVSMAISTASKTATLSYLRVPV